MLSDPWTWIYNFVVGLSDKEVKEVIAYLNTAYF